MSITRRQLRDLYNHLAEIMEVTARHVGSAISELSDEIIANLPEPERAEAAREYGPGVDRDVRIEKLRRKVEEIDKMVATGLVSDEMKKQRQRIKALADLLEAQKELEKIAGGYREAAASYADD
ncbi:MAG: hypothetical protein Kow006_14670 [Gammaproteobacteria bacterium]